MPIHQIEDITLDGKNQAYRGHIYSCDLQIGLVNEPTKVKIAFANEDGVYLEPELSATKPHRLKIGNVWNGNVYPITWERVKTSNGRVLVVDFYDGSIALDRIFVGLYKRHGDEKTNIEGLIIVGREVHPCDANEDGVYDQTDANLIQANRNDPCELKCPHSEKWEDPIAKICIEREIKEVLPVKYNFQDLLNAIQGKSSSGFESRTVSVGISEDETIQVPLPSIKNNPNTNIKNRIKVNTIPTNINLSYLADFTGTLREVLGAWCAEFGWSFYWEDDTLSFIDTKARPQLKTKTFANLAEETTRKTLEGTLNRGYVSNYLTPAIEAETQCSVSKPVLLRCLDLADLYGEYYKPIWSAVAVKQGDIPKAQGGSALNPPYPDPSDSSPDNQLEYKDDFYKDGVPIASFEKSVVFSLYDENLRHMYNLCNYYGVESAQAALDRKNKWMDRLGQMKILNVFDENVGTEINKSQFKSLRDEDVSNDNKKSNKLLNDEDRQLMILKKGYFVVAKQDGDLLKKQYDIERRLASDFIGQHWLRPFVSPFMGDEPSITPNGQYFGALSTNVQDLPFASFGHTYKSPVSQMVSAFVQRQRNDYRQYGYLKYYTQKNISKKLVRSIIYFNRNNAQETWTPLPNSETSFQALKSELQNLMFKEVDISSISDIVKLGWTKDENGNQLPATEAAKIKLFIFFPYNLTVEPDGDSQDFVKNPNEEDPLHGEDIQPFKLVTYGLTDKQCVRYTVNGFPIYMPAGSSVLFDRQTRFKWKFREPDRKEFSVPRYKVFASTEITNRGIIPKTESILVSSPSSNAGLRTEYNVNDINQDSVRFIGGVGTPCVLDPAKLLAIHQKLSKYLNFSVVNPFESRSYTVFGINIPEKIGIADGLESVSVRIDDSGGVITNIGVGNSLFTPASPNYILKQIELGVQNKYVNTQKNPI